MLSAPSDVEVTTDVLVVGAGPCGLTAANLLGTYGINAIVMDREIRPLEFPRAVGIDDESLRTCQSFGLVGEVVADAIQNTPIRYYTSWGRCFAHVKPSAQPFGWPRRNLFLQPMFETTLRQGLERFANIETRYGWELLGATQDAHGITATIQRGDDPTTSQTIRARYLLGADGGRSTVRALLNLEMLGETAAVKWLVIDVADDELDAPYSAVYCDAKQPVLMIPLPYKHRRWEFKVPPHADEATVTSTDHVLKLLKTRYGKTPLPTVLRARVYLHHSRTAERFGVGRMFVAGDAAHLQPPFFGQGMNSGLRDATNLAWKLAAVVQGRAEPSLLETYDRERRPHATEMVKFATRIGAMYSPKNVATERVRDQVFKGIQKLPGGRDYVLQMKYKPMPHYTEGAVVHDPKFGVGAVGRMFMQVDVEQTSGDGVRERLKLDDAIGPWFAVIGINADPRTTLSAPMLDWWTQLGAKFVNVVRPRSYARSLTADGPPTKQPLLDTTGLLLVEDVDGGFRDWLLSNPNDQIVVLRPDRYVAATSDPSSFDRVSQAIRSALRGAASDHR
jgi:3-(3-hydroxy-phenyl)propionate hydroxylase